MRLPHLVAAAGGLVVSTAAFAHHGPGVFDYTATITIEGTIAEVEWKNPHVFLTVDVAGPDGAVAQREVEAASLSTVRAFGLEREMLPVGAHVVLVAYSKPNDPDSRAVKGVSITLDNGASYFLESNADPSARREEQVTVPAEGLAGQWTPSSPFSFGAYMTAYATAPLTDVGRAALATGPVQPPTLGPDGLCTLLEDVSAPFGTAALYILRTIETSDAAVVMRSDVDGAILERTVHLDEAEHPADVEPTAQGHSIGRWEGETLVIDTVGFAPDPEMFQGAAKHLVERLTLTEDHLQLRYEFIWDDPEYFTAPLSYSMLWDHRPELEFSGEACDEATAQRYLEE